jgi:preprotein translocase subunit SecE
MNKVRLYLKDTYDELRNKVSWPSWSELQGSAIVVSIASIIIAMLVFIMDIALGVHGNLNKLDPASYIETWRGILGYFYWFLL